MGGAGPLWYEEMFGYTFLHKLWISSKIQSLGHMPKDAFSITLQSKPFVYGEKYNFQKWVFF